MKKKIYVKPATNVIRVQTDGCMLSSSQTPIADTKHNGFDSGLWDSSDDDPGVNWAGYRNYNKPSAIDEDEE